jgi:hypothetical protein
VEGCGWLVLNFFLLLLTRIIREGADLAASEC